MAEMVQVCPEPVEPNPEQILGGIMLELIGLFKMTHNYFHAALRSTVALVLLEMSFVSDTTQFRGGGNLGRGWMASRLSRLCGFI